jgi:hypothetical protein
MRTTTLRTIFLFSAGFAVPVAHRINLVPRRLTRLRRTR